MDHIGCKRLGTGLHWMQVTLSITPTYLLFVILYMYIIHSVFAEKFTCACFHSFFSIFLKRVHDFCIEFALFFERRTISVIQSIGSPIHLKNAIYSPLICQWLDGSRQFADNHQPRCSPWRSSPPLCPTHSFATGSEQSHTGGHMQPSSL